MHFNLAKYSMKQLVIIAVILAAIILIYQYRYVIWAKIEGK